MKATLSFNLPEEQPEFDLAVNGAKYRDVVWYLNEALRRLEKYPEEREWPTQKQIEEDYFSDPLEGPAKPIPAYDPRIASHYYSKIRELLWRELGERNLGLDP